MEQSITTITTVGGVTARYLMPIRPGGGRAGVPGVRLCMRSVAEGPARRRGNAHRAHPHTAQSSRRRLCASWWRDAVQFSQFLRRIPSSRASRRPSLPSSGPVLQTRPYDGGHAEAGGSALLWVPRRPRPHLRRVGRDRPVLPPGRSACSRANGIGLRADAPRGADQRVAVPLGRQGRGRSPSRAGSCPVSISRSCRT